MFHDWLTFELHHMLENALKIIIWNRITKGFDFITFVTFVIFCFVRKMEIS